MVTVTAKGEEMMTDFQFKSLVKMIFGYVEETEDVEKIKKYLLSLIREDEKDSKDSK
jgi:hypothetical protein